MSDPFRDRPFPRGALISAAALIGFSLAAVAVVRVFDVGKSGIEEPPTVQSVNLRFEELADGALVIYQSPGDAELGVLEPGGDGFLRGVLRSLARERDSSGVSEAAPFRLAKRADGRLTLEDLSNGRLIDLRAFGPTNERAFSRFLPAVETAR